MQPESGIGSYEVGWGTTRGSDNLIPFISVPANVTAYTAPFAHRWRAGVTVFGSIRARSRSGANTTVTARGQRLDTTPPNTPVLTGPMTTVSPFRLVSRFDWLRLAYSALDPESAVVAAALNITAGRLPGGPPVFAGVIAGSVGSGVDVQLPTAGAMTNAANIHVCVRVMNEASLWSAETCGVFGIDRAVPSIASVRVIVPGQSMLRNESASAMNRSQCLSFEWSGCSSEFGIDRYELRITSNANNTVAAGPNAAIRRQWPMVPGPDPAPGPGVYEELPWQSQSLRLTASNVCLSWTPGVSYYASVRCVTGSGLVAEASSPSIVLDPTPPGTGVAGFGEGPTRQRRWVAALNHPLPLFWALDETESRVTSATWAIGTGCGRNSSSRQEDMRAFEVARVPNPGAAAITAVGVILNDGGTYCVTIRASNAAGWTAVIVSDSVSVDLSPPFVVPGAVVRDGADRGPLEDADFAGGNCSAVAASWSGVFADRESVIVEYAWCVGSAPGACDVLASKSVGNVTTATADVGASLHGRTVFATAWGRNGAGVNVSAVSDGVMYDCNPPAAGHLAVLNQRMVSLADAASDLPFVRPAGWAPSVVYVTNATGLRLRLTGFNTTTVPLASLSYAATYTNSTTLLNATANMSTTLSWTTTLAARAGLNTGTLQELLGLPSPGTLPDGTEVSLVVTATHAGGASITTALTYRLGVDSSRPVATSFTVPALSGSSETVVPVCFTRAGDPHSSIATALLTVFTSQRDVPARVVAADVPMPSAVAAMAGGALFTGCVNVSTPSLPSDVRLRARVTLINNANLSITLEQANLFFLSAQAAPQIRSVVIPPQALTGSALYGPSCLAMVLHWTEAVDAAASGCCRYTALFNSVPSAEGAVQASIGFITRGLASTAGWSAAADGVLASSSVWVCDPRIASANTSRVYVWIRATNEAEASTVMAAQRPLVLSPPDAVASLTGGSVLLRSGEAPLGDLPRGHQAVLTDSDAVTLLFAPPPPRSDMSPVLHEAQLFAVQPDALTPPRLVTRPISVLTPVGLNRTAVFRGLALGGAQAARYRAVFGVVRVTMATGESVTFTSANATISVSPAGGVAALLGGRTVPLSAPLSGAVAVNGGDGAITVGWTGLLPGAGALDVAVGTGPYGVDIMPYTPFPAEAVAVVPAAGTAPAFFRATVGGLDLPLGVAAKVFVTVRSTDAGGVQVFAPSNDSSLLVTSPPAEFAVFSGPNSADAPVVGTNSGDGYSLTFSWVPPGGNASAATLGAINYAAIPSGLARWEVAVSRSPTAAGPFVLNWTVIADLEATSAGLTLPPPSSALAGTSVYVLVAAVSRAGLRRVSASSAVLLDPSQPVALSLVHPPLLAGDVQSLTATWSFSSLRAGRDLSYSVALGAGPGLDDIVRMTTVGSLLSYTFAGLSVASPTVLFVSVTGCNALGVCATIISVQGTAVVNGVPTSAGAVALTSVALPQAEVISSIAAVAASAPNVTGLHVGDSVWVAFDAFTVDAPAAITRYAAAIGDGPGLGTFGSCVPAYQEGSSVRRLACVVMLTDEPSHQTRLWAVATAFASSGLATSVVSGNSLLVDRTEPAPFTATLLQPLVTAPYTWLGGVAFTPSEDPESGSVSYEGAIQDGVTRQLLVEWTPIRAVTTIPATTTSTGGVHQLVGNLTFPGTPLGAGQHLLGVRAVNRVGLATEAWAAERVVVDNSAPLALAARVSDGHEPTADAQFITPRFLDGGFRALNGSDEASAQYAGVVSDVVVDVWISWSGFSEPESWIEYFLVGLGTSPEDGANIAPLRRTTGFSSHVFPSIPAPPGAAFYGFVAAVNAMGNASRVVASNGALADLVPPQLAAWAAAARLEEAARQEANLLANASQFQHIFSSATAASDADDPFPTATPRPLLTVGLPGTVPPAIAGGAACVLTTWPFEVMSVEPLTSLAVNASDAASVVSLMPEVGATLRSVCVPGSYRTPLGACTPCTAGYWKATPGDEACAACPVGTLDELAVESTLVLTAARSRVLSNVTGPTGCGCLDPTQVFVPELGTCVCRAGYLPSPDQDALLDAWRAGGELADTMCLLLSGDLYKPVAADNEDTVGTCPPGTQPSSDHATCLCALASLEFNADTAACECRAGAYASNFTTGPSCAICPTGTFKAGPGNALSQCLPCPFGATHNATRTGCRPDDVTVPGAVMHPNGTFIACGPGTQYDADVVLSPVGAIVANNSRCEACPDGLFQPLYIPLDDAGMLPTEAPFRCGACPPLQHGSVFASSLPDLFLDWSNVFSDGLGSGLDHYEVAVGSVVGGSQIVPWSRFPANTTRATLRGVVANPGAPLFLSVVAADRAGNAAVFEDVHPVFIDLTAPLPGTLVDGTLEGFMPPSARVAASAASGATALADITSISDTYARMNSSDSEPARDAAAGMASLFELFNDTSTASDSVLTVAEFAQMRRRRRLQVSPSRMPTAAATSTRTSTGTATTTRTTTGTRSSTASQTASVTSTRSGTATASGTGTPTLSGSGTRSLSASATVTTSATTSGSGTASRTGTGSGTPSVTPSGSGTASITPTSSWTPVLSDAWVYLGNATPSSAAAFPLRLTAPAPGLVGAAWTRLRVQTVDFELRFRFTAVSGEPVEPESAGQGLVFAVHRGPGATTMLGAGGVGLGYAGISSRGMGVRLQAHSGFGAEVTMGFVLNGSVPEEAGEVTPPEALVWWSPEGVDVVWSYSNAVKQVTVTVAAVGDPSLAASVSTTVDLPRLLACDSDAWGACEAFLGFTAATGPATRSAHVVSHLVFVDRMTQPSPSGTSTPSITASSSATPSVTSLQSPTATPSPTASVSPGLWVLSGRAAPNALNALTGVNASSNMRAAWNASQFPLGLTPASLSVDLVGTAFTRSALWADAWAVNFSFVIVPGMFLTTPSPRPDVGMTLADMLASRTCPLVELAAECAVPYDCPPDNLDATALRLPPGYNAGNIAPGMRSQPGTRTFNVSTVRFPDRLDPLVRMSTFYYGIMQMGNGRFIGIGNEVVRMALPAVRAFEMVKITVCSDTLFQRNTWGLFHVTPQCPFTANRTALADAASSSNSNTQGWAEFGLDTNFDRDWAAAESPRTKRTFPDSGGSAANPTCGSVTFRATTANVYVTVLLYASQVGTVPTWTQLFAIWADAVTPVAETVTQYMQRRYPWLANRRDVAHGFVFALARQPLLYPSTAASSPASLGIGGVPRTVGIRFDTWSRGVSRTSFGYIVNGQMGLNASQSRASGEDEGQFDFEGSPTRSEMVWWRSGGWDVQVTYANRNLSWVATARNSTVPLRVAHSAAIDVPAVLGCSADAVGCAAHFGFTGTVELQTSTQTILEFQYRNMQPTVLPSASRTPSPTYTPSGTPAAAGAQWGPAGTATAASDVLFPVELTPSIGLPQVGGLFSLGQLAVDDFALSFAFDASSGGQPVGVMPGDGLALVIHRDPRGGLALGEPGNGVGVQGLAPSFAARFDAADGAFNRSTFDWVANGVVPDSAGPIDLTTRAFWARPAGHVVSARYSSRTQRFAMVVTPVDASDAPLELSTDVDLPALLQCASGTAGCTAWFGWTAGTSAAAYTNWRLLNASFLSQVVTPSRTASVSATPQPTPPIGPTAWVPVGGTVLAGAAAALPANVTQAAANQTGALWLADPVWVNTWNVTFVFGIPATAPSSRPMGHGLCFVIHRDPRGTAALGAGGAGLGYAGITSSFALRFDTRGAAGEEHSLGFETGGSLPQPGGALPMTLFRWADVAGGAGYTVRVSYNDSARKVAVTATQNFGDRFSLTWVRDGNLQAALGCPPDSVPCSAVMGFTAATGAGASEVAAHRLLSFGLANARATASPAATGTPSPVGTPSSTGTPRPTPSASVGPPAERLPAMLTCPAGVNCSSGINVCRANVVNVRQQYAVFALGRAHGCAIDRVGDIRCFGSNTAGQAPPRSIAGPFFHVAVTDSCSCGLLRNGSIMCWGVTAAPGCPASLTGAPSHGFFTHLALSTAGFMVAVRGDRRVVCVGDASQPGCAAKYLTRYAYTAVAAAGGSSCALADGAGFGGDRSLGGDVFCFGAGMPTRVAGPFGSIAAVGASAFCGLTSLASGEPGALRCWGPGAGAILDSAGATQDLRHMTGSYHDPVVYMLNRERGYVTSADGDYDASRGCGGAPCACNPGSRQCDARTGLASDRTLDYAQAPANTGLLSSTRMSCGVSCSFDVACFGPDAAHPVANFVPGWLRSPCAVAVPQDVGTPANVSALTCRVGDDQLAGMQRLRQWDAARSCNVRGLWNNGTLFLDQQGEAVTKMYPLAERYGSLLYRGRFTAGDDVVLTPQAGLPPLLTVPDPAKPRRPKLAGRFTTDCARVVMADGSRWDVTSRCAVRYLRIARGAGASVLALGEVSAVDAAGVDWAHTATLTASSALGCADTLSGARGAQGCLRAVVDGRVDTGVITVGALGDSDAAAAGDPHGWLQLDFGREVYLSTMTLRAHAPPRAGSAAAAALAGAGGAAAASLLQATLLGVTVEGFDDFTYMTNPPPLNASGLAPAFVYRVVPGDELASDPSRYEFRQVSTQCGYDARSSASATATPSASITSTASTTPTLTASATASRTNTPTRTPTRSNSPPNTPTRTSTRSMTPSGTPTPSATASGTGTGSGTPTMVPAAFRNPSLTLNASDAAAIGAGGGNASQPGAAAAPYDWRTDESLLSLADAPDVDFQASTNTLAFAWEPFEDVGSAIARVAFCVGTSQFACDVVPWVVAPAVKSHVDYAVLTGLNLTSGAAVYATVAAVNHVGLMSMISSDGVYVEDRAPLLPVVYDTGKYFLHPDAAPGAGTVLYRPPVDINCDAVGVGVGAAWPEVVNFASSADFDWSVGTAPNASDILPWVRLGNAVAAYNSTLVVPVGVTYFVNVRATGANGRVAYASSDGVLVIDAADEAAVMTCLPFNTQPTDSAQNVLVPRMVARVPSA